MSSAAPRWPEIQRRITSVLVTGVTDPPAPRPARLRRGRVDLVFLADVLVALIFFGATNAALGGQNTQRGAPHSASMLLLVSFLVCAPLVLRTRLPLTAWSASLLATVWASWVIPPRSLSSGVYPPAAVIVYGLCLYAVTVRCRSWVVVGAGILTVFGAVLIDPRTSAGAILAAIPLLAGVIVRSRRSSRNQLAAQELRHEGERALLEERQRIARELHDVVAHHMSVIAIQAEAAPYKVAEPPQQLVESFTDIRASALSGLDELRRLLGVLRSDEPGTAPQPGLADLAGLLDSARSGGVTVTAATTGPARPLPRGVDLSAYRIVQEALSNAIRHAPGSAVRLQLSYRATGLMVEVRNDAAAAATQAAREQPDAAGRGPGGGHGIIGMRERAVMLGGHLAAGPAANGEFLVTAFLPLDDGRAEGAP
jgi:signal transduction histidine kinase